MRINSDNKTMDMEARDINYILPAYVRSYQFYSKNEMPTKIIFPMFASIRVAGIDIPIEWAPPLDAIAVEIAKDGDNVVEVTPEQEATLDKKDDAVESLKAEVAELTQTGRGEEERGGTDSAEVSETELTELGLTPVPEEEVTEGLTEEEQNYEAAVADLHPEFHTDSPARTAFAEPAPDRIPKQPPGGAIPPGQPLSDMHARDIQDQARTARDLLEEPELEGAPEKEFEKEISRDEQGRPKVEDKPDAPSGQ